MVSESAQCAAHPDLAATTTCKRCGTFLCEACCEHGLEDRCRACRPKRTAQERRERRANAVKRAEWNTCQRCGYLGPRFDRLEPFSVSDLVVLVLLPLVCNVLGLLLGLLSVLRGTTKPACPSCGETDQLLPAPVGTEPNPAFFRAFASQDAAWLAKRKHGLLAFAVIAAVSVVVAVVFFSRMVATNP